MKRDVELTRLTANARPLIAFLVVPVVIGLFVFGLALVRFSLLDGYSAIQGLRYSAITGGCFTAAALALVYRTRIKARRDSTDM
jgi:O-antigen/teichoic acid export membrane protein